MSTETQNATSTHGFDDLKVRLTNIKLTDAEIVDLALILKDKFEGNKDEGINPLSLPSFINISRAISAILLSRDAVSFSLVLIASGVTGSPQFAQYSFVGEF